MYQMCSHSSTDDRSLDDFSVFSVLQQSSLSSNLIRAYPICPCRRHPDSSLADILATNDFALLWTVLVNGRKKKTLLYRRKTKLFCSQSTIWWLMWKGTDSIWESQIQIADWLNDQVAKVESTAETNKQMLASEKCGPQVFLSFSAEQYFSSFKSRKFSLEKKNKEEAD